MICMRRLLYIKGLVCRHISKTNTLQVHTVPLRSLELGCWGWLALVLLSTVLVLLSCVLVLASLSVSRLTIKCVSRLGTLCVSRLAILGISRHLSLVLLSPDTCRDSTNTHLHQSLSRYLPCALQRETLRSVMSTTLRSGMSTNTDIDITERHVYNIAEHNVYKDGPLYKVQPTTTERKG